MKKSGITKRRLLAFLLTAGLVANNGVYAQELFVDEVEVSGNEAGTTEGNCIRGCLKTL